MHNRSSGFFVFAMLILALGGGCSKSGSNDSAGKQPGQSGPAAAIHWIGMGRVAADTNAAGFLKIWRLPESERLKAQTLDKLALLPWGLPGTNHQATITNYAPFVRANHSASLLRLVLEDLISAEWYLEIRDQTPQSGQIALAVQLRPERAGVWETNLGAVLESLTGARRTLVQSGDASRGWDIRATQASAAFPAIARHAQLIHSGQWMIFGLAVDQNAVFADLLSKVQHNQTPGTTPEKNDWLETALDFKRLSTLFSWGWDLPQDWPRISFAITGNGKDVVTRGHLNFSKPLPEIEPWNIPASLIHEPLHSFTAVQGLKSWLSSWPAWQNLHAGAPPNQLFCWAQGGSPFLGYAASPLADAPGAMAKIAPAIMDSLNPLLATNRTGKWERATNSDGLVWNMVPIINPFVQSTEVGQQHFLLAGLSPLAITNTRAPTVTLKELTGQPNVVYFDREITSPREDAWVYLGQLFRIIMRRNQLPPEGPPLSWLKASGPFLGTSATTVTKTGPAELSLVRTSTVGLTALELQLLADWLESPRFPFEPHSVVSKLPPFPVRHAKTTSPQSSLP
jgi:hypothetical protein